MSSSDEILTAASGKNIRVDEVGTGPIIEDTMNSTHCPVIRAEQSREELVRCFPCYGEVIIREGEDPFSWNAFVVEENAAIKGESNQTVRGERLVRRDMTPSQLEKTT